MCRRSTRALQRHRSAGSSNAGTNGLNALEGFGLPQQTVSAVLMQQLAAVQALAQPGGGEISPRAHSSGSSNSTMPSLHSVQSPNSSPSPASHADAVQGHTSAGSGHSDAELTWLKQPYLATIQNSAASYSRAPSHPGIPTGLQSLNQMQLAQLQALLQNSSVSQRQPSNGQRNRRCPCTSFQIATVQAEKCHVLQAHCHQVLATLR